MERKADFEELRRHYPMIPEVGPTGSVFVEVELTVETNDQVYQRLLPPSRPTQEYEELVTVDVDDDGEEWPEYRKVKLTDEEYAAALAAYEVAKEEWGRSGGRLMVAGVPTVSGRFTCEDGTVCAGQTDGREWRWTEWVTR